MTKLATCVVITVCFLTIPPISALSQTYFIAPNGSDSNPGTLVKPFATLQRAQQAARQASGHAPVTIFLRGGTYYLTQPLVFTAQDSSSNQAPVVYKAYQQEQPVISGGTKLNLKWEPYKDGIFHAKVQADLQTDQIFINGDRQILARYPNYDPKQLIFNGTAADAIRPERAARWANPTGGFTHIMHSSLWGDFSYVITGKTPEGKPTIEGGWQNNRPPSNPSYTFVGDVTRGVHKQYRFVENIFEELDSPGEWFLNTNTHTLYYYPPPGLDLNKATVEAVRLKHLIEFQGSELSPAKFVSLKGLTFRHTLRTFMDTREPILRSDWAIYRGGAVFFNGVEDCSVEDCLLDQLGGNAIFVNNYNRHVTIRGCQIAKTGANGVVFLGDPKAVRSALFNYNNHNKLEDIDQTPGPKKNNYPADCLVENCLIYMTGRVEKQTAPVEIDMAENITVRHCSIYDVPRAGINIGDGCWGGHIIEFCDVFDTVKETGDHGSFNSWGRDRYWLPKTEEVNARVAQAPELPMLDAVKPVIIRNNRWRCDHGWDIDLDDGSSNYQIYNNLCLNGGIKNREGYRRLVENNIMVSGGFCPHCWFADSGDIFRRNIVWTGYKPARMPVKPWGLEMDYNFMQKPSQTDTAPAVELQKASGRDEHSLAGDALFADPINGDYRVKDLSPVLALGFKNFPMDQFGVQKPSLKSISRTPDFPDPAKIIQPLTPKRDKKVVDWQQTKVRNIVGQGEMSAYGTPGETGVLVLDITIGSPLANAGLHKDDVILSLGGKKVETVNDLLRQTIKPGQTLQLGIIRNQKQITIAIQMPQQ